MLPCAGDDEILLILREEARANSFQITYKDLCGKFDLYPNHAKRLLAEVARNAKNAVITYHEFQIHDNVIKFRVSEVAQLSDSVCEIYCVSRNAQPSAKRCAPLVQTCALQHIKLAGQSPFHSSGHYVGDDVNGQNIGHYVSDDVNGQNVGQMEVGDDANGQNVGHYVSGDVNGKEINHGIQGTQKRSLDEDFANMPPNKKIAAQIYPQRQVLLAALPQQKSLNMFFKSKREKDDL